MKYLVFVCVLKQIFMLCIQRIVNLNTFLQNNHHKRVVDRINSLNPFLDHKKKLNVSLQVYHYLWD